MKTKREHKMGITVMEPQERGCERRSERGNALVYVLIAIALFAALSFTLGRQTDTGETGTLAEEQAELRASQLISYAAQTRSAVDQMLFTAASDIDDLDFTASTDANFDTGAVIHKVYHPSGGGLVQGALNDEAVNQVTTDPVAGWYMGRFNNVEWTDSVADEVILVAYQIREELCQILNEKINGSSAIPTLTVPLRNVFIDDTLHGGTNVELTTDAGDICPDCSNIGSLCVQEGGIYGFYTIIADQ